MKQRYDYFWSNQGNRYVVVDCAAGSQEICTTKSIAFARTTTEALNSFAHRESQRNRFFRETNPKKVLYEAG